MYYNVLGLMSGTSLDGLDIAYCEFDINGDEISYAIKKARTVEYDNTLRQKILDSEQYSGEKLCEFSAYLGDYFGRLAREFIDDNKLKIDFIASHGQTIFHQPYNSFTCQIGNINSLAAASHCTVVGDFRSLDVALGGQGAPLVPIGDKLLFQNYDCCLNIGGFSNISYDENNVRHAFDICPSNIVLNFLANKTGKPYDDKGNIAKNATVDEKLLSELNSVAYYTENIKKSLAKEFVIQHIFPILEQSNATTEDKIATYTRHIALQIAKNIKGTALVTGGGAFNDFLIEQIKANTPYNIIIPDKLTVEYKEALIFAFLGVRRMRQEINCLASVTGAKQDSCCGTAVYFTEN